MRNLIVFRDYETGSRNPLTTQPLQLSAVVVDAQKLKIVEGSAFNSLIKPEFDDQKAIEQGIAPLEDQALEVNNLSREQLAKAPPLKLVWENYCSYIKNYNVKGIKGRNWDSPIISGFNNVNFDDIIDKRLCQQFGPKSDDGRIPIYHPFKNYDLQILVCIFFDYLNLQSVSMDSMREYMGISKEMAHNGIKDVLDGAFLLIKFLRLFRLMNNGELDLPKGKRIKFENCFEQENNLIKDMMDIINEKGNSV